MKRTIQFVLATLAFASIGCNNKSKSGNNETAAMKPGITENSFDEYEGKPVTEYTITNASGMQVSIINYGGTVTRLITPDKDGKMGDVILGFDSLSGYLQKGDPYFGALIGRYGNRIANGKFS